MDETRDEGRRFHPPAKAIFWAQDQDRSLLLIDYAWTLWEQSIKAWRECFDVKRPRERQAVDTLEFKAGGKCLALPGKDPNKIRSEHPTILVMDEACFIEKGGEAHDVAVASKVPRVWVLSSAAPSWFRMLTKPAVYRNPRQQRRAHAEQQRAYRESLSVTKTPSQFIENAKLADSIFASRLKSVGTS